MSIRLPSLLAPLNEKLAEVKSLLDQLVPAMDNAIEVCDTAVASGHLDSTAGYLLLNVREGIQYAHNSIDTNPLRSLLPSPEQ